MKNLLLKNKKIFHRIKEKFDDLLNPNEAKFKKSYTDHNKNSEIISCKIINKPIEISGQINIESIKKNAKLFSKNFINR